MSRLAQFVSKKKTGAINILPLRGWCIDVMLKVGLTGSIAVGKSFVLEVLRELGARTIDADQVARECVEPETPGLVAVVSEFGNGVLQADGALDRAKLGAVV